MGELGLTRFTVTQVCSPFWCKHTNCRNTRQNCKATPTCCFYPEGKGRRLATHSTPQSCTPIPSSPTIRVSKQKKTCLKLCARPTVSRPKQSSLPALPNRLLDSTGGFWAKVWRRISPPPSQCPRALGDFFTSCTIFPRAGASEPWKGKLAKARDRAIGRANLHKSADGVDVFSWTTSTKNRCADASKVKPAPPEGIP